MQYKSSRVRLLGVSCLVVIATTVVGCSRGPKVVPVSGVMVFSSMAGRGGVVCLVFTAVDDVAAEALPAAAAPEPGPAHAVAVASSAPAAMAIPMYFLARGTTYSTQCRGFTASGLIDVHLTTLVAGGT